MSGLGVAILIIWGLFTCALIITVLGMGTKLEALKVEKQVHIEQCNKLVREYNKLLSYYRKYKDYAVQLEKREPAKAVIKWPFNKEDTRALLALCHPDKHGGSKSATRITQMLLEMRP